MDEDEILEHYGDDDIPVEAKKEEKKTSEQVKKPFEKPVFHREQHKEMPIHKETPQKPKEFKNNFHKNNSKKVFVEKKPEHKKHETFIELDDDEPKKENKEKKNPMVAVISVVAILLIVGLTLLIVFWNDIFKTAQPKDTAALVNGEIITKAELEYQYNISVPEGFRALVSQDTFLNRTLIPQLLLLQEAKRQSISLTDAQVEEQIDTLLFQSGMTKEEFETQIEADGLTFDDVKELYRTRLTIAEFLNKTLKSQITVTESDVKHYYDTNTDEFTAQEGQIRAAHILVATEEKANELLQQLRNGADFASIAKAESTDTGSGQAGGDLGFFTVDQMVPEFGEAAFALKVNELSDVVQSQYGYHIIKRLPDTIPFDAAKNQIEQALISGKQNAALETYLAQLRSTANIQIMVGSYIKSPTALPSVPSTGGETFMATQDPLCTKDGKPVIRLFSTTTCPHCRWIKSTFDRVAKEYVDAGQIVAYHWELDAGDDTLTTEKETKIPKTEYEIFQKYSTGGVPTYVFGCRYYRIGNGYESTNDLSAEEAEFRSTIEKLIV